MIILLFGRDEVFAIMGGGGGLDQLELESRSHMCVWEQVMNGELRVRACLMNYLHG